MASSLRDILTTYTVDELQVLLMLAELRYLGTKAALMASLIHTVFDTELQRTWNLLLPVEQLAVAEAIYNNGGFVLPTQVKAKYGKSLLMGPGYLSTNKIKETPKIWLFRYKRDPIPQVLIDKLKKFVPKPEKDKVTFLTEPSIHNQRIGGQGGVLATHNGQKTVLQDLVSVLGRIKNEQLQVHPKTQLPTLALTTKINKMLVERDYYGAEKSAVAPKNTKHIRGFAWIILLSAAQLILCKGDVIKLTKAGEEILLGTPKVETIKMVFEAFLRAATFDEVFRIDTLSKIGKGRFQAEFTAPDVRRGYVIAALRDCVSGSYDSHGATNSTGALGNWVRLLEFLRHLRAEQPRFWVANFLGNLSVGKGGTNLEYLADSWPHLEGSYVKCLLMEYLATLGILEIKYHQPIFDDIDRDPESWYTFDFISSYDGLYEFRITELGVYCLGLTKEMPQMEEKKEKLFHVMPNLEITAVVDQLFKSDVLLLDMCMDKVNEKTWKLSRTKLLNVVEDKNFFLTEFKSFVYKHALSAIPKTVEHFFEDLERRTDQIAYVEESKTYVCKDKTLAQLIANDTKTKPHCLLAGDHHLIVPLKSDKQFKTALKKVGYITTLVS